MKGNTGRAAYRNPEQTCCEPGCTDRTTSKIAIRCPMHQKQHEIAQRRRRTGAQLASHSILPKDVL